VDEGKQRPVAQPATVPDKAPAAYDPGTSDTSGIHANLPVAPIVGNGPPSIPSGSNAARTTRSLSILEVRLTVWAGLLLPNTMRAKGHARNPHGRTVRHICNTCSPMLHLAAATARNCVDVPVPVTAAGFWTDT
jgi:hypothetical protein